MNILGIESSCDDTAAAVVCDGRYVKSSIVASQVDEHKLYGGVVPEIASRRHIESIAQVTSQALDNAQMTLSDIDAIAVTYAPGLIGSLLVGVNFAKGLSYARDLPLVPVHHLRSHVASNYISNEKLEPPFLCLIVSGGHSHIVYVKSYTEFSVLGKTRDDSAGEVFDKVARRMGLDYPGGVHMDEIAEFGDSNVFHFPHPKMQDLDYSFSGLKTAAVNLLHGYDQKGEVVPINDFAASFRATVVDCLLKKFKIAIHQTKCEKIAVCGGVSANRLLRRKMQELCDSRGLELYMPELKYCGDNAAMVGAQGYYEFLSGNIAELSLNAFSNRSVDKG